MFKGATWNKTAVASTTLDVPVPPNTVGDLMVIAWARFTNSLAYPTNADLTNGVGAINNWSTAGISYKTITGASVTSPYTITFAGSAVFSATIYIIGGQHASPIGATATNNNGGASTNRLSAASLTTTAANSMIIRSTANRSPSAPRVIDGSVFNTINAMSVSNDLSSVSGIDFVATSGGTTSAFHYERGTSVNFVDVALEIKTDGTTLPIRLDDNRTILLGNTGYGTPPTWVAPNAVGISTINGKSMGSSAPTVGYGAHTAGSTEFPQQIAGISYTTYVASTFLGGFVPITGSISSKVVCIPWGRDRNGQDRIGSNGMVAAFVDTSGNWVAYTLRNYETSFNSSVRYDSFIKYGSTAELDSSLAQGGTEFDPSVLAYFGLLAEGSTAASSVTSTLYFPILWCEDSPSVMLGGGPDAPVNVSVAAQLLYGGKAWLAASGLQGTKQFQPLISFNAGDGTNTTYLKTTGQSISFPTGGNDWKLADGDQSLKLVGSSGCTLDMSSSIVVGESRQVFSIESATSVNLTGASFINLDWSNNADVDSSGASFADCNLVDLGGGTTANATISTPNGTTSATISVSGAVLDGVSLSAAKADGTATDYQLTLGTSVTAIALTDVTFTGTPVTDKVHVLATTGTVTITTSGTTSLAPDGSDVTSAGATIVMAVPEVYQSVTISGLTSGSRVQIYDTTAATELANSTQASPGSNVTWASATTMTWTDPVAAAADRTIRVRIAYVSGTSAKGFIEASIGTCGTTDGTEAVSYLANQVDDAVYNANGIDGPSIYATSGITFTDSGSNDRINCNIGGGAVSWGTIYACFAYWMSTSTGIADDIAYVTAVDTANYLLDSLKIKNTSATPLTITGGWGRDATSLTIADCIDTAGSTGNIFPQPDHVVAYATGSGSLTAGDITNIWSNGSRTLTTTIPSAADNASAVAAVAVDGTVTLAESMRLQNSMLGGKVIGAGTGTEVFRSLADDKDRVTVTVDSVGNRSAVVRDLT